MVITTFGIVRFSEDPGTNIYPSGSGKDSIIISQFTLESLEIFNDTGIGVFEHPEKQR
jgi:hypothetical protein